LATGETPILDLELPLTRARRAVILLRWSGSGGLRGVLAANQMYEVTQKRLVRSFLKKHLIFSFTFTYMHKLKHVRDTFKVLQLFFHPNHCILATFLTTNLTIKNLHSYPQCASIFKTKKVFQNHAQAALDISARE